MEPIKNNSGKVSQHLDILITIFFIIILGLVIAIPIIKKHINRQRSAEGGINLRKIYDAEVTYWGESKNEGKIPQFVSAPATPEGTPGKEKRSGNWNHPSWKTLKFNPGTVRFTYNVQAEGVEQNASFTIFAVGDVDGDGETCMFRRNLKITRGEIYSGKGGMWIGDCD